MYAGCTWCLSTPIAKIPTGHIRPVDKRGCVNVLYGTSMYSEMVELS